MLGGEQSGHVIFRDLATTGDGVLTGLLLLDRVRRVRRPLSELAASMTHVPQLLESVRVGAPARSRGPAPASRPRSPRWRPSSAPDGRVLVRASGTEPVIRVMVEAASVAARPRRATEGLARSSADDTGLKARTARAGAPAVN